jgi:hypothetical protein
MQAAHRPQTAAVASRLRSIISRHGASSHTLVKVPVLGGYPVWMVRTSPGLVYRVRHWYQIPDQSGLT